MHLACKSMLGHGRRPIKINANVSECVQAPISQFDLSLHGSLPTCKMVSKWCNPSIKYQKSLFFKEKSPHLTKR